MQIRTLMSRNVHTCRPDQTLETAARIMRDHDVGVVPIVNEAERLVGIITDRDICIAACTRDKRLSDLRVEPVMSRDVLTLGPNDSLSRAEHLMRSAQIRRVPIVDADGKLVGLLSQNDLIREAVRERLASNPHITTDEAALVLEGIGRPRAGSRSASAE